uniref:ShKT domain-containing protein n=1 Tax=Caenorhabditis tropicalis TaxID=1561998 RepID=A0A1I7UWK2_9PELO
MISLLTFLIFTTSGVFSAITDEFSCTAGGVYTASATSCSNSLDDSICEIFYPTTGGGFPAAGNSIQRPYKCYSTDANGGSVNEDLKKVAMTNCAKTCGFCCKTPEYNCPNAQFPSLNCDTILPSQCTSPIWRQQIAENCPATCGLCNEGGCVDAVENCANDITICNNMNFQPFVNQYCQKTCGRCSSSPSNNTPTCTYKGDSSTACAAWAANGYCTNPFYTDAQRKLYCATTCKIC